MLITEYYRTLPDPGPDNDSDPDPVSTFDWKRHFAVSNLRLLETGSNVAAFYLAVVQDDRTDEPPSAAG